MTLDQITVRRDTITDVVKAYLGGKVDRVTAVAELKSVKPVPLSDDGARQVLVTLDKLKQQETPQ